MTHLVTWKSSLWLKSNPNNTFQRTVDEGRDENQEQYPFLKAETSVSMCKNPSNLSISALAGVVVRHDVVIHSGVFQNLAETDWQSHCTCYTMLLFLLLTTFTLVTSTLLPITIMLTTVCHKRVVHSLLVLARERICLQMRLIPLWPTFAATYIHTAQPQPPFTHLAPVEFTLQCSLRTGARAHCHTLTPHSLPLSSNERSPPLFDQNSLPWHSRSLDTTASTHQLYALNVKWWPATLDIATTHTSHGRARVARS